MKIGKLRRDMDSHWFLIPDGKVVAFDRAMEVLDNTLRMSDKYDDLIDDFCDNFQEYMLGGGIGHLDVIIPE